jgi:hypothetical protein
MFYLFFVFIIGVITFIYKYNKILYVYYINKYSKNNIEINNKISNIEIKYLNNNYNLLLENKIIEKGLYNIKINYVKKNDENIYEYIFIQKLIQLKKQTILIGLPNNKENLNAETVLIKILNIKTNEEKIVEINDNSNIYEKIIDIIKN